MFLAYCKIDYALSELNGVFFFFIGFRFASPYVIASGALPLRHVATLFLAYSFFALLASWLNLCST